MEAVTCFGETDWWVISKAGRPNTPGADAARDNLCQMYWWPVFFYVRRLGYCSEDAQDLTQAFFSCVLEKNYVRGAVPEKGKFRSFLLVMLKCFLADQRDRTHRQKRGGGNQVISLDSGDTAFRSRIEPADELTPEKAFERTWADSLLSYALDRLEEEMAATGKKADFQQLKPLVCCESEETHAVVARRLQWSEANVKVTVHRLRRRLGELLRAHIAKTAATPDEVEEEIRDLFSAFQ
jgi:RNA polymerase sigma factor (sigma-70 family)